MRVQQLMDAKAAEKAAQQQRDAMSAKMLGAEMQFAPKHYEHPLVPNIKYAHGTTTLGFVCDAGVLIAVDSRKHGLLHRFWNREEGHRDQ